MYSISNRTRETMLRVLDEVLDAHKRAGCSDAYFRHLFMTLVTLPIVGEAAEELRNAVDTVTEKWGTDLKNKS